MEHLRNDHTSVLIDASAGCPRIAYWGVALNPGEPHDQLAAASSMPLVHGSVDDAAPLSVLPELSTGYPGQPGLLGARVDGNAWAPRLSLDSVDASTESATYVCTDPIAGIEVEIRIDLGDALTIAVSLTNNGASDYALHALTPTLPVPPTAVELLQLGGRWAHEFQLHRQPWQHGVLESASHRGRTSHDRVPLVFVGTSGFSEQRGEVWGAHLAWSGNHRWRAEVLSDGRRCLQIGEFLLPGEVVLAPGECYRAPVVVAVHSPSGLVGASAAFHRVARAHTVAPKTPRPVTLNTWEALYFDHDQQRLFELVREAARCGVERFVLDDGWFSSRRNDTSGLGDWWVSEDVYPGGLNPLIDHVHQLGMQFGLWVEPEMVNRDSQLFRSHPDWVLSTQGYDAPEARNQLVLDLSRPDTFAYIESCLDSLLDNHHIDYLKWDMNRDHVQGSDARGRAATRRQVLALYRLMEGLRRRHPGVEIESCSSGGGRIDFGILQHCERVWASDCNDALERQHIQRALSLFVPHRTRAITHDRSTS